MSNRPENIRWRQRWYDIVFESDTPAGKRFDVLLLIAILGSLLVIMLESVPRIAQHYRESLRILEWFFTILFTVEYFLRIAIVKVKRAYLLSFYGIIDLLSILPSFLAFVVTGGQYLMVIRSLRLIRVFRVLKMMRFMGEAKVLSDALRASRAKIIVFLVTVICIVFIMGTLMYLVEGPEHGFTSIPTSVYWCIVTLTTVGYGDISPVTPLGQFLASVIMIMGYGVIAVPTGIVTAEMSAAQGRSKTPEPTQDCAICGRSNPAEANYCNNCGHNL